ncbi:pleckstrin homology domain-containing family J member 1 [Pteropus alecto]|uniref:pleckstrin homology domain-containing family J member 1 n=1 Tax=Pteropus alecto TaxID=9402 RepID=UPI0007687E05|nr:pleckstrin homology domain-containing family J member 1 [Pteropus alecto]
MRYNEKELQRTDEAEPVGALLLEHCRVTQEEPTGFSIRLTLLRWGSLISRCSSLSYHPFSVPGFVPATLEDFLGSPGEGFVEDPERKYHFECCSEEQCQQWMGALRQASYEFMRRSLIFYRNEIQKMTGKDPLEQFGISEEARFQLSGLKA